MSKMRIMYLLVLGAIVAATVVASAYAGDSGGGGSQGIISAFLL